MAKKLSPEHVQLMSIGREIEVLYNKKQNPLIKKLIEAKKKEYEELSRKIHNVEIKPKELDDLYIKD